MSRKVSLVSISKSYSVPGERYGRASEMIPYGAETGAVETRGALQELGLEARQYFLYVSRMEPENNALLVREAFERVATPFKLALVGDAPYAADYIRRVRDTRDPRVAMPGAIYGEGYRELGSHCFAYIHATEVGRHASGADRGDGARRADAVSGYSGECRGRRRRGDSVSSRRLWPRCWNQSLAMPEDECDQWRARAMERRPVALQLGCGDGRVRKTVREAGACVAGWRFRARVLPRIIAPSASWWARRRRSCRW